jgi:Rad9
MKCGLLMLDGGKVIRTQLNLSPDEFDVYTIGVDAEITFCLKELRVIIEFVHQILRFSNDNLLFNNSFI